MNELLQISTARLQRILKLKRQIERLQAQLGKLAGGSAPAAAKSAPKRRRKMSAAGRRAISLAAKARWAKLKAAQK